MFEIFGDGHDYDWALAVEDEDEDEFAENEYDEDEDEDDIESGGGNRSRNAKKVTLKDVYDLQDLKKNLMTDEDIIIRKKDIPERFQEIRQGIQSYDESLTDDERKLENKWISDKIANYKNFQPGSDLSEFEEAIGFAINFISKENLEVPFIYAYRRNYISSKTADGFVLNEDDLWEIVYLDIEFHSIVYKKRYVENFYKQLNVFDSVVEEYFANQTTKTDLNALQDIYNYLEFNYAQEINQVLQKQSKKHLKYSNYEKFKNSSLYQVVKDFGISSEHLGENIINQTQIHPVVDHPTMAPKEAVSAALVNDADQVSIFASNHKLALETVVKYLALEISHNTHIRERVRHDFYQYYVADVKLTPKGKSEIQKGSPYEDIKYAINRTPQSFHKNPDVFLRMLEAEQQHYLQVSIHMSSQSQYTEHLFHECLESTDTNEIAVEWNEMRKKVFEKSLEKIFHDIASEIKDNLKKMCETLISRNVRHAFLRRLDQAPYIPNVKDAKIPKVLSITCGNGKFGSDAIIATLVNRKSELAREFKIVANPFDRKQQEGARGGFESRFEEIVNVCQPNCIAINGPNPQTSRFVKKLQEIITRKRLIDGRSGNLIPLFFVDDQVAICYQHSKKSEEEFPGKSILVKYCIALARYLHSPLLEYASLSAEELICLNIHPHQSLLPKEFLTRCLESCFVDIVNLVGVEINKTVDNKYYSRLLPYVSGFGKRKAIDFVESLQRLNEPLLARQQLITHGILQKTIFMNASGFLYIDWNTDHKNKNGKKKNKISHYEEEFEHDLLDSTRIHPEDYHLATKVAADALETDPDIIKEKEENRTMNEFVEMLQKDPDGKEKLESLNLEQYAEELEKNTGARKLNNLNTIVLELLDGFEELRNDFHPMTNEEIFYNLTGETDRTFFKGCIIPIRVEHFRNNGGEIICVSNSGIECTVPAQRHLGYQQRRPAIDIYEMGKTYPAKILYINYDNISCEVSLLPHDIEQQYVPIHYSKDPSIWDIQQEIRDLEKEREITMMEARAKRKHRVINHPYYYPFTGRQAEDYLRSKERGDFVIRQSSLGDDHLAITWKLDKDLFQHVDILEQDKENPLSIGKTLIVENERYHDLDQIIVDYLQNKVRLLNEITNNEKFKNGTKKEVIKFVEDYSKVNPNRSVYYFSFNYDHPGWFYLMFKINDRSKLYVWNVKLTHTGYYLVNYNYPTVIQLCNGFKTLLKSNRTQRTSGGGATSSGNSNVNVNTSNGATTGTSY
ncbi:probable Transcription elongation factor SPT6 [Saccharomycodes ludwigii]|uniref:Transcription elongation factor Spt6 n=1 Tax=Saccharomycodes ludwigii TaxID=36035 RepID=A0A376B9D2_9ASCO|nr:probable Transcription elongation factor SPT6 [Saccharomycodes ludwigii]